MRAISIYVAEATYIEMKRLAHAAGRPASELIRQAMEEYVERRRREGPKALDRPPHDSGPLLEDWTRDELLDEMMGSDS